MLILLPLEDYFKKDSPDFVNGRGEVIDAHQQVDALGQAQSIGTHRPIPNRSPAILTLFLVVYLSIFIIQCFNVRPSFQLFAL